MKVSFAAICLVVPLVAFCGAAQCAEPFAPAGAKAILSVDYLYESAGKKRSEGMYDPYEWKVTRRASLTADLAAQPATAMPTVQAIDSAQMANPEKGLDGPSKQDGPRYQAWRPTAQRGNYVIDETVHISVTDPICTSKPRHRCTRDEVRKGGGEIPVPADANSKRNKGAAAGISAVELDATKNTITVGLPVPLAMLPYTETITTDEPPGTHDTPTPGGPQQKMHLLRLTAAGGMAPEKPFTVQLKGGWRGQQGERMVKLKGNLGDGGTLIVRWRFAVQ